MVGVDVGEGPVPLAGRLQCVEAREGVFELCVDGRVLTLTSAQNSRSSVCDC